MYTYTEEDFQTQLAELEEEANKEEEAYAEEDFYRQLFELTYEDKPLARRYHLFIKGNQSWEGYWTAYEAEEQYMNYAYRNRSISRFFYLIHGEAKLILKRIFSK